ncbi:MAG: DNA translocase FtsK 4TM domain-containing protein [Proteobacteria bacterium]|nr:DNA translocase FtsK 4TM domain-containing protein [Pseudomonadota bacterium]MDA0861717.1 DNA translocase FtsK 4TM domain-containing protein [Pseudomonadota bacterium]MDA1029823.1 DNA translocase FtsK 4TM domain-containing protein [Pseudomonadota bacterium]
MAKRKKITKSEIVNQDSSTKSVLPPKVVVLLREVGLLLSSGVLAYLTLVLGTYDSLDPAWSRQSALEDASNAGGVVGAHISDVLLYLFGISAWWIVLAGTLLVVRAYRHTAKRITENPKVVLLVTTGLALLVFSSAAFEGLRLYSAHFELPGRPGGIVGEEIALISTSAFGFIGSTLMLLILMAVGISLVSGISWITISEKVGYWLEWAALRIWQGWESWRDKKAGEIALEARMDRLDEVREKFTSPEQKPLRIDKPIQHVAQSERAQKEKQKPLFEDLPDSELPSINLLDTPPSDVEVISSDTLEYTSRLIEKKLLDFNIEVRVVAAQPGPVITRYEIEPAVGVKGSQIINLTRDLARSLSVVSIRVVETIPGKTTMGLEIPNTKRQVVYLSEVLASQTYADVPSPLAIALGKDISGVPVCADLAKMPHLLVAGTTGSGKSVAINAMILSLLYKSTPNEVRMILVDPKMLELSVYERIPHLLAPVVTEMPKAAHALNWCVGEMDRRYRLMSALGVRNLSGFNTKIRQAAKTNKKIDNPFSLNPEEPEPLQELPLIVVVIDELADLIMVVGKKIEELIARLAQKARAAGIHLILATQRPSVDVITGLIKANIPTRIAFQVSSRVDSRTILDQMGAEQLLGQGDMLYLPPGSGYPQRVHGAFVDDQEVHRVVDTLKSRGEPQYIDSILEAPVSSEDSGDGIGGGDAESDPLYDQAVEIVLKNKRASISLVQRHLRIGYNRAARLVEQMESAGLVSSMSSSGSREIIAPNNDR